MWKLRDIQKDFASLTGLPQISAATAGSESLGGQRLTVSAWGFGDRAEGVGKDAWSTLSGHWEEEGGGAEGQTGGFCSPSSGEVWP